MESATPSRQQRDALIHAHLPLADTIAAAMAHRYGGLVERDDLIQVARLELVRAAARINRQQAEPYLGSPEKEQSDCAAVDLSGFST